MTTKYVYVVENGNLRKLEVIKETPKGFKVKMPTRWGGTRDQQVFHERQESHFNCSQRYAMHRTFTDSKKAQIELMDQLREQREYLEFRYQKAFDELEKQEEKLREFEG